VETPADIQSTITRFIAQPVIMPTSTLTTGYSFMAAPAAQVGQYFSEGVPGSNDQLIDPQTGGNAWTATQLQSLLTSKAHQLVFLGAHFSANDALAADDTTYLSTQQFANAIGTDLNNSLVLGAGCHAGYTIDPTDATPVTNPLSWPQAFTEAGATLVAGSGYQFGDSNYVADSDQVYVDMAQQLYQTGGGAVQIGTALLDAESQYLASLDELNGLEEKSLLEITLYGLPMLNVQEPSRSSTPVPAPSTIGVVTGSNLVTSGTPGSILGTQEYDLPVTVPSFLPVTPPGTNLSYDPGPAGEVADPGSPIVPVMTKDVNVPNYTLTGVGFIGGSYTDTSGAPPLTGDPVTDTSQPPTPFSSPVYYPEKLTNPNYFATLDTAAGTELGITPEQYVSDPATPGNAIKREYSSLDLHLFYSNNTASYGGNVPALAAPPDISNVTATESNGQVAVSATITGDPSAGIQEAWVTYTDPPAEGGQGTWASLDLAQSSTNTTLWTGTFTDSDAGDAVFEVQAANGVGDVSLDNNQGYYFSPTLLSSTGTPTSSSLTLSGDTTDAFGATANVTAALSAASSPVSGQQITFTIGPATSRAVTISNTGTASAQIPLSGLTPGTYTLTANYLGDASDSATSATEPFVVKPASTALSLTLPSPAQITSGASSGISAALTSPGTGGAGVAQKTVYFDVSNSSSQVVAGSVGVTNQDGVAQAGVITLPTNDVGDTYTVTAYFGSPTTPLPNNPSYNATDPDYAAATSASQSVDVQDSTQTSLQVTPSPSVNGQAVTLTATVTPAVSVGTVTFSQGNTMVCTTPVTAGTASCPDSGLGQGSYSFSASYSDQSGSYLPSGPATAITTVAAAATTTTLTAPASSAFGAKVPLSAQVKVTSPGSGTPTGTVTFYDGSSIIGTGTLALNGAADVASISVSAFQAGTQSLSAVYGGSASFTGSSSASVPVTVGVTFTKAISTSYSGPVTVTSGQTLLITGKVSGPVTVLPGGGLEVDNGAVSGPITTVGAIGVGLCGATVSGTVSVVGSTGYVFIGGGTGTGCARTTISGPVTLSGNSGGVEVATSTVSGPVTVINNSGNGPVEQNGAFPPTEVAGNKITGPLWCAGNKPSVTDAGQSNSSPLKIGQCDVPSTF
jgi:hypothetical protein